jgi:hypothetical protein
MVVFVDLDDEFPDGSAPEKPFQLMVDPNSAPAELSPLKGSEVSKLNINGFSAALSCYP